MKKIIFIYIACFFYVTTHAQVFYPTDSTIVDGASDGVSTDIVLDESFHEAIPMYLKLLEFNPESSNLNYKLGFCYLHSIVEKGKAISYFEKAVKNMGKDPSDDAPIDAYFYLGQAYRVNTRFQDAYNAFNTLRSKVDPSDVKFIEKIDEEIRICNESIADKKAPQDKSEIRKQENVAESLIKTENFDDAIRLYRELLVENPANSMWNYKLGFCYLNNEDVDKDRAITHLQRAVDNISEDKDKKKDNAPLDAYYYLGKAYSMSYKYAEAVQVLEYLKTQIPAKNKQFADVVERELEICQNVMSIIENPVQLTIKNLGPVVNSPTTDHSPVISADQTVLMFTSRREGSSGGNMDYDDQYFEDIYITHKDSSGNWTVPQSVGDKVNTSGHEATIGLSPDGQDLYMYRDDDEGSIYVTQLEGDTWQAPRKLGANINTKYRETHATVSADGNSLYFTSERPGGMGGLDIYVSQRMTNGDWGPAQNLGSTINTEYDEEGPYIHPDGITLYFSSRGHNSIGELDIFTSVFNDTTNTWSEPENIGFPINTSENDVYYVPTPNGLNAYYVSKQDDGYGEADIYLISLSDASEKPLTVISGVVSICTNVLPNIKIVITDSISGELYGNFRVNNLTGKYLFVLTRGHTYNVQYLNGKEVVYRETLPIPLNSKYQEIYKGIRIKSGTDCDDDEYTTSVDVDELGDKGNVGFLHEGKVYDVKLELQSIMFKFDNSDFIPRTDDLDKLAQYLKETPDAIIEVGAHADAKGSDAYNLDLTQRRAYTIRSYLMTKGAKPTQIQAVGYGEKYPVAINVNPDGSWNDEAQMYNRRIEIKVIKQGAKTLLITPIRDIPDRFKIK